MSEDTETYTLCNDNEPNVRFVGVKLAEAENRTVSGPGQNRWDEFDLFLTQGGKFVCQKTYRTCWQNEDDTHDVSVVDTEAEVVEYFGHGDLAKQVYKEAGIDSCRNVA